MFAAYASPSGYCLLDRRLFIPENWFSDEYAARRKKCNFPETLKFKTKPQLAAEMFRELEKQDELPFKFVVADSLYGSSPEFIEAVENCVGVTYFVSIPHDTLCWLKQPITRKKLYKYKGEIRSKLVVEQTEDKPISVKTGAEKLSFYRKSAFSYTL